MPIPSLSGSLSGLVDELEAKALVRAVRKAARKTGSIGGGIIIDTRGRRWNPALHPRDSRGRFIETGGIAQVWGGGRGRVVRALGNGRIELRMADGSRKTAQAARLTMVSRPNGGRPIKDDGTRKSRAMVMAQDVEREKNGKRGDGVKNDDDGDGIPDHLDKTPEGFKDGPEPDWDDDGRDDDLADGPEFAGKRRNARPQVLRDEFSSVDEVKKHWTEDLAEDNPEFVDLVDRLESAQLSGEGEHLVARVDGRWQVFRADDGKVVAGHNGSATLVDKKSALAKAEQLDDVYDPDVKKAAPGKRTGPKLPRGHRDAGHGYSIKEVKPDGDPDGLKQIELYDLAGQDGPQMVASTTSRINTRAPQAPGWRGDAHGLDIKTHNEADFVARAKQINAAVKLERDPQALDRIGDRYWRELVRQNGGDEKKAARAARAHVSQKRAQGKGSKTTPRGRVEEKVNQAIEKRAAAAEAGRPVPSAAPARQDAPNAPQAQAPSPTPNAPAAPAAPQQRPNVAAADMDRPQSVTAKIDELTDKVDALTEKIDGPASGKDDDERGMGRPEAFRKEKEATAAAAEQGARDELAKHDTAVDKHRGDTRPEVQEAIARYDAAEPENRLKKRAAARDVETAAIEAAGISPQRAEKAKRQGIDEADIAHDRARTRAVTEDNVDGWLEDWQGQIDKQQAILDDSEANFGPDSFGTHRARAQVEQMRKHKSDMERTFGRGDEAEKQDDPATAKKPADRDRAKLPEKDAAPSPQKDEGGAAPAPVDDVDKPERAKDAAPLPLGTREDSESRTTDERLDALSPYIDPDSPDYDEAVAHSVRNALAARGDDDEHKTGVHLRVAEAMARARKDRDAREKGDSGRDKTRDEARDEARDNRDVTRDESQAAPEPAKRDEKPAAPRAVEQGTLLDEENDPNPTDEGTADEGDGVRADRGEVLDDVPAAGDGADGEPGSVLPPDGEGNRPAGGAPGADAEAGRASDERLPGEGRGDSGSAPSGGGNGPRADGVRAGEGAGNRTPGGAKRPGSGRDLRGVDRKKPAQKFKPRGQQDLSPKGDLNKAKANLDALEVLRKIEADGNRPATPEEQVILARWGGWGAAWRVFEPAKYPEYKDLHDRLRKLVNDPEEWKRAEQNAMNAHYTDADYVQSVWDAVRELGFDGGNVLEPGSGAGNFIGFAPDDARMVGVELDPISANMSRKLYPDAQIRTEGFEDTVVPDNTFDLTIGNVPFADVPFIDPEVKDRHSLHNGIILKSLRKTRPGGLVAVLTSTYTMDAAGSKGTKARQQMAELGDFVGAIRLPAKAHESAAGTGVVTDLLVFRKRADGAPNRGVDFERAAKQDLPGGGQAEVNDYFLRNPQNVLGTMKTARGQFSDADLTVDGDKNAGPALKDALNRLVREAKKADLAGTGSNDRDNKPLDLLDPDVARHEGHIGEGDEVFKRTVTHGVDGKPLKRPRHEETRFTQVEKGVVKPFWAPQSQQKELSSLLRLRDLTKALLKAETESSIDTQQIARLRKELNDTYDRHVKAHKFINRESWYKTGKKDDEGNDIMRRVQAPSGGFRDDPASAYVYALEDFDSETGIGHKTSIFEQRTVQKRSLPSKASSPEDALAIAQERDGEIRLHSVGQLLGTDAKGAREALGDLVFDDPLSPGRVVSRDEYLSGDVRQKIKDARWLLNETGDEKWRRNIDELEKVKPTDLTPGEIDGRLGAAWIPEGDVQDFARALLGGRVTVDHNGGSEWDVKDPREFSIESTDEWGTSRAPAGQIIQALLRNKPITVKDPVKGPDGKTTYVVNVPETEAANTKAEELQERFAEWLWEDPDRARRLADDYNDRYNGLVMREYDGSPLALPGLSEVYRTVKQFRPHQNAAVRRIVNEPAALLAHEVGAGKTLEMVAGVMELRRLGLAKKPAIVVPGHMLEQFSREFLDAYPNAKILAAGSKDLEGEKRRRFVARAATGDWDAIILTQRGFQSIGMGKDAQKEYLNKQLDMMRQQIAKAQERGDRGSTSFKRLQKMLRTRELKLQAKIKALKDTKGMSFEETGVDYLMVDEAHHYKNLTRYSGDRSLAIEGSDMATDLDMKLFHLRGKTKSNRVVTFATATPIANTISEVYTMTHFLRPDLHEKVGITDFDTWVATFGEKVTDMGVDYTGGFSSKSRFKRFRNVPEMLRMFRTPTDVKTAEDLNLPVPKVNNKDTMDVVIPASDEFLEFQAMKLEELKNDKSPAAALKYITAVSQASLDLRLQGYDGPPEKLIAATGKIGEVYRANKDREYPVNPKKPELGMQARKGALQIVFADSGTPDSDSPFNAYEAMREMLVRDQGIPREQIRFMHEAKNDQQKAQMFADARAGKIAVLIGSTKKMGVGTNVQDRAVALHHMDVPWVPADLQQREGRIIRQGNLHGPDGDNSGVQMFRYITEGSIDAYRWQTVRDKSIFIAQVMKGRLDQRDVEDLSEVSMSYQKATALGSGKPELLEKAEADELIGKLARAERKFQADQRDLVLRRQSAEVGADRNERYAAQYAEAIAKRGKKSKDNGYDFTFDGKPVAKRADVAPVLADRVNAVAAERFNGTEGETRVIGNIGGLDINATPFLDHNANRKVALELAGVPGSRSDVNPDQDANGGFGIITRLENRLDGLEARMAEATRTAEANRDFVAKAEERIGAESPHAEKLALAQAHSKALGDLLALDDAAVSKEIRDEKLPAARDALNLVRTEKAKVEKAEKAKKPTSKESKPEGDLPSEDADLKAAEDKIRDAELAAEPRGGQETLDAVNNSGAALDPERVSLDPAEVQQQLDGLGAEGVDAPKAPTPDVTPDGDKTPEPDVTPDGDVTPDADTAEQVSLDPEQVQQDLADLGTPDVAAPKAPRPASDGGRGGSGGDSTPPSAAGDAPEPAGDGENDGLELVDAGSTFGDQNPGQTMLAGDGLEMGGEEFMLTDTAPAPKAPKAPAAPTQEAEDLFDVGGASLVDKTPAVEKAALSVKAGDRIRTPDGKVHDVIAVDQRRDGVFITTRDENGAETGDLYDIGEKFTVLTPEQAPATPDAPATPAAKPAKPAKTPKKRPERDYMKRDPKDVPATSDDDPFGIGGHVGEWSDEAQTSNKWAVLANLGVRFPLGSNEAYATWEASHLTHYIADPGYAKAKGREQFHNRGNQSGIEPEQMDEAIDALSRLSEDLRGRGETKLTRTIDEFVAGYYAERDGTSTPGVAVKRATDIQAGDVLVDVTGRQQMIDRVEKRDSGDVVVFGPDFGQWGHRMDPEARFEVLDRESADATPSADAAPSAPAADAPAKPWKHAVIDQGPNHRQIVDPDAADRVLFDVEKMPEGTWSVHAPTESAGIGTMFATRKEAMAWAEKYAELRRDGKELPDAEGNFFDDADAAAASAPSAPSAPAAPTPAAPKPSKKPLKRDEVTFHESYGNVSRGQLAAYKKHNVPPATHDELVRYYGENEHERIRQAVINPANHMDGSTSFSDWKWREGLADEDRLFEATKPDTTPDVTPDGAGNGRGGDVTPPAPATPDEPEGLATTKKRPGNLKSGDIIIWPGDGKTYRVGRYQSTGTGMRLWLTDADGNESRKHLGYLTEVDVLDPRDERNREALSPFRSKVDDPVMLDGQGNPVPPRGGPEAPDPTPGGGGRDGGDTTPPDASSPDGDDDLPDEKDKFAVAAHGNTDPLDEQDPGQEPVAGVVPSAPEKPVETDLRVDEKPIAAPEDYKPRTATQLEGEKNPLTTQQQVITDDAVIDEVDVIANSKAGTGKTTVAVAIARRIKMLMPKKRGGYLAFNRSVADEAIRRMPDNVEAMTGHAAPVRWKGRDYVDRRLEKGIRADVSVADFLGINDKDAENMGGRERVAWLTMNAINRYSLSADDDLKLEHFSMPDGRSLLDGASDADKANMLAWANKAWSDIAADDGKLYVTYDDIRKQWALARPDFSKKGWGFKHALDFIMLDEAQDTPPVLAKVMQDQKIQRMLFGDSDQAIYGSFTGSMDVLKALQPNEGRELRRRPMDISWRYGDQIADAGNRPLQIAGSLERVVGKGKPGKVLRGDEAGTMTDHEALLVRSNAGMLTAALNELEAGRVVGVPKGMKGNLRSLIASVRYLRDGGPRPKNMHEDLARYSKWSEFEEAAKSGDDVRAATLARILEKFPLGQLDDIVDRVVEMRKGDGIGDHFALSKLGLPEVPDNKAELYFSNDFPLFKELKKDGYSSVGAYLREKGIRAHFGNVPGAGVYQSGKKEGQPIQSFMFDAKDRKKVEAALREFFGEPADEVIPDVELSTVHKAKGAEWKKVKIHDDFRVPRVKVDEDGNEYVEFPDNEEMRIAYVAFTRAQGELDAGGLDYVFDYTDENGGVPGAPLPKKIGADEVRDAMEATGADTSVLPERAPTPTPDPTPDGPDRAPVPTPAPAAAPETDAPSTVDAPGTAPDSAPTSAPNAPDNAPLAPAAQDAPARRPVGGMSDDDIFNELNDPATDEDRFIELLEEEDRRQRNREGFGGGNAPRTPTESVTKRQRMSELRAELVEENRGIADRGWDPNSGGQAPSDGLDMLPKRYRKTIFEGGKIPASVIAKYVPEETTLHLWQMTPDEMRAHGFTHYGIPGAVHFDDRVRERFGNRYDDPRGVLRRDVEDLHDDELDEAIGIVGQGDDEEHLAWLGLEQARRAQLSDEDRAREDQDRRDRRADEDDEIDDDEDEVDEPEAAGDGGRGDDTGGRDRFPRSEDDDSDGGPAIPGRPVDRDRDKDRHPLPDMTDDELDKHIDEHDKDDEARRERDRRRELGDDEREREDEDRKRRRRNRRDRRNRRRRRRDRGGMRGRRPHMPDPNPDERNLDDDDNGAGLPGSRDDAGARPAAGSDGGRARPTVDGDPDEVEKSLETADDVDPVDEDARTPASGKPGKDMTPDELAAEDASVDEAYGDHAPNMEHDAVDAAVGPRSGLGERPKGVRGDVWDRAKQFGDIADEAGMPVTVTPAGQGVELRVDDPADPGGWFTLRLQPAKRRGQSIVAGSGTNHRSHGGESIVYGPEVARRWRELADAHRGGAAPTADGAPGDAARPTGAPSAPDATVDSPGGLNAPETPAQAPSQPGSGEAAAVDVPEGATWEPVGMDEVQVGDVIRHPATGQPVKVMGVDDVGSGQRVISFQGEGAGEPSHVARDGEVLTRMRPDGATPSQDARPDDTTPEAPASAPNTPAPSESAPSAPGASTPGTTPPAAPSAPATPDAAAAGIPTGQRLPDGLTPEQAAAMLRPGPDGLPPMVAVTLDDGRFIMGRPVAGPDGTLAGIDTGSIVEPVTPGQVRTVRPVDVTPATSDAPDAADAAPTAVDAPGAGVVDEYGPDADTPIPDGLDVGPEALPDAFGQDATPPAPMPARPRPRPTAVPDPVDGGSDADAADSTDGDAPAGGDGAAEVKPSRRRLPSWARRGRRKPQDPTPGGRRPGDGAAGGSRRGQQAPAPAGDTTDQTAPTIDEQSQVAAYVSPVTLQIGDYARVEGFDVNGRRTALAGFLMDDPQPVLVRLNGQRGEGTDMLAVTVSDEYDGLGVTSTVYVPLDSMASLAPRPDMDEVPDEGWMKDQNRLNVRDGKLPEQIPTDRAGLGLFPGSEVAERRRRGRVVATRGRDVSVMWDDSDEPENRAGGTLTVVDYGAARPDGWSSDGRKIRDVGTAPARRGGRSAGRTAADREAMSEAEALAEDIFDRIERITRRIQRGNLSRRQQEELIRQAAREALDASSRRRAEAARRIAGAYPHRPGLLAQIAVWLHNMAVAVVRALVEFWIGLREGAKAGWAGESRETSRQRAKEAAESSRALRSLDEMLEQQEAPAA